MKKSMLTLLICSIAIVSLAQSDKDVPFMTKSLAGQTISRIEAETSGGNISVEPAGSGQARVDVYTWSSGRNKNNATKEEIQKILDEYYELKVDISGGVVTAIARSKSKSWNRKNSLSISFKIYTSANVSTLLTTSGGNINLAGVTGEQKITTSGGNLSIERVKGKIKGTTSGGNIHVRDSDQDINLTTSGGNIDANNCKGDIKLVTSGGNIILANLNGQTEAITSGGNVEGDVVSGSLEASTSGGNVELKAISGDLSAATSGGNVRVEIKDPGKFIKIRNSGGDIALQLPAGKGYDLDLSAKKIKTDNLSKFTGKTTEDELNGKLNGGGSRVSVDGRDGKITLTIR